jgi:hypothetical protein
MDSLEFSTDALSTKGLFYNKKFTVYVEGKDDKIFWDYLFQLAERDAYIEDVGGNQEIEKYINRIIDENADFIAACDCDHSDFYLQRIEHPNLIITYGYSIENSIYNQFEIQKVIQKLSRSKVNVTELIENWKYEFSEKLKDLIVYDVANSRFNKGVSVIPNNCSRFLNSSQSHIISLTKINTYLKSIESNFSFEEINEVKGLVNNTQKDLWFHIRGHFLSLGVANLIKSIVSKIDGNCPSISTDILYALTIDFRENWENKIDIKTVVDNIKKNCS